MDMEVQAPLDAFARGQQAGLGALARLSGPGDEDLPEPAAPAVRLSTPNMPIGLHER